MTSRNLDMIVGEEKNSQCSNTDQILSCTAATHSRNNTHQDIVTPTLMFDLMQSPPGWCLPSALKTGAHCCSRETGSLGSLGMCYNRYWVCYCTSRREKGSVFRCGCGVDGEDVYLSFLVTQTAISHSIFKAWRNRPQPSISDCNPIKHHMQINVSLQQDNQVKDVKCLICGRRSYDCFYVIPSRMSHWWSFVETCWSLRPLQTSGHWRMFGCLVWGSTNPSGRNFHAVPWNFPDP